MPPPLLFPLDDIDLDQVQVTREQIYQVLPHAHEFQLVDGVNYIDRQSRRIVAFHDVREDELCRLAVHHCPQQGRRPGHQSSLRTTHAHRVIF